MTPDQPARLTILPVHREASPSRELFTAHLDSLVDVVTAARVACADSVAELADLAIATLRAGRTVLVCGNGGSAADAQHFAAELVGRMGRERPALPAIALTADSSVLTAVGNDYGFEQVFARQVRALGRPGDLLVAVSTSGRSSNVLAALGAAADAGVSTALLTGGRPVGPRLADVVVSVPTLDTAHVQELHIATLHAVCLAVEAALFPGQD